MAFESKSVNGYAVAEESLTLPDPGGATESTVNSSSFSSDLSDKQILVQLAVTETSNSNGALEVRLQGSLDDENFTTLATTSMAVDSTGTNTGVDLVDLTSVQAPYYRLQVFSDGTDIEDSADVDVSYAYKLT